MSDRDGIFSGDTPWEIFERWMVEAEASEPNDPNAMTLATVDEFGLPNARVVLLKQINAEGLVFFTNYESKKGRELISSGQAAVNFHWKSLRRQVRFRGSVTKCDETTSDAYFASRPAESRIAAIASRQSCELESAEFFLSELARAKSEHGDNPTRPENWGGFVLRPTEIEFWSDGAFRTHDRFRWLHNPEASNWRVTRLFP